MKSVILSTLALGALAGAATADVSYMASVPQASTNFSEVVSLPQWDPALFPNEVLIGVVITLTANVDGRIRAESNDGEPATINADLAALVTANAPAGLQVVSLPLANFMFAATAFDGSIDFGGTSGFDTGTLAGADMDSNSLTFPPGNSVPYIGNGNIAVTVTADGASIVSGAGNIVTVITTEARATLEITYQTRIIPAPGAAAMLGLGGLLIARRRR
ncbi:MAG: choice-of-anchor E domain-containing protein [Phycisphaerales bacterium]